MLLQGWPLRRGSATTSGERTICFRALPLLAPDPEQLPAPLLKHSPPQKTCSTFCANALCALDREAGGLFGVTPLLLLGHLTSLLPEDAEKGMLAAMATIFAVFAARKYTQVRGHGQ